MEISFSPAQNETVSLYTGKYVFFAILKPKLLEQYFKSLYSILKKALRKIIWYLENAIYLMILIGVYGKK